MQMTTVRYELLGPPGNEARIITRHPSEPSQQFPFLYSYMVLGFRHYDMNHD